MSLNGIELRLLRYFVAVAEAEHIGRASAVLHISQSPLSRQIRQLEEALGLQLFERERQRLHITNAGRWLLGRARRLLDQADALGRDATRLSRGEAGTLRVGFVKSAMWTNLLPRALRAFRATRADVAIELRNAHSATQLAAIRRGAIDIGLVHESPTDPSLSSALLTSEPLCLALRSEHMLATRKRLSPKDLDGADWIVLSAKRATQRREAFLAGCARAGFTPNVRFEVGDQGTVLGLVEAGMGFALLPNSASSASLPGVTLRRLAWLELTRKLYVVTRSSGASAVATEFLACLNASAQ